MYGTMQSAALTLNQMQNDKSFSPWILATIALALLFVGCGDSATSSTPPPPPPTSANIAIFTNAQTGFQTADVRDVNDEIMRFDTSNNTLIWTPDGSVHEGWPVNGNLLLDSRIYQVRFGTVDGEERAYFTETARRTICDLSVVNGTLQIEATSRLPPTS